MYKFIIKLALVSTVVCCTTFAYAEEERSGITVKFDRNVVKVNNGTVTIDRKAYDKSKLISDLTKQIEIANREIQELNPKATDFTSINVTKDCCASVSCAGGKTIKCCITGPGSCESGTFSVACITANTTEQDVCGPS